MRRLRLAHGLVALAICTGSARPASAQEVAVVAAPESGVAAPPPPGMAPGAVFWRALLVPGWGHAAIGSYTRGGFYVAAQAASLYTLFQARARISEAQQRVSFREGVLTRNLARQGITDPDDVTARLAQDEERSLLGALQESRKEQQEDMLALSLFPVLIRSADAYASAHLARFPEPLDLEAAPSPTGGVDVGLRLTVPHR